LVCIKLSQEDSHSHSRRLSLRKTLTHEDSHTQEDSYEALTMPSKKQVVDSDSGSGSDSEVERKPAPSKSKSKAKAKATSGSDSDSDCGGKSRSTSKTSSRPTRKSRDSDSGSGSESESDRRKSSKSAKSGKSSKSSKSRKSDSLSGKPIQTLKEIAKFMGIVNVSSYKKDDEADLIAEIRRAEKKDGKEVPDFATMEFDRKDLKKKTLSLLKAIGKEKGIVAVDGMKSEDTADLISKIRAAQKS